jgi:putative ABC transport system substrate-binding protein
MMKRRTFLCGLTLGTLAAPLAAKAQTGKVPRIGVIVPNEPESPTEPNIAAFRQGLRRFGYVEAQNIAVEYRYAHGKEELYAEQAAELVTALRDAIGTVLNDLLRGMAGREDPAGGRANEVE